MEEERKWLQQQLAVLDLASDPVYIEYIEGILQDDTSSVQEKTESIIDFLSAATDKDLTEFRVTLQEWGNKISEVQQKQKEEKKKAAIANVVQTTVNPDELRVKEDPKRLPRDEAKKRNELLARFGYTEERFDENGDILLTDEAEAPKGKSKKGPVDPELGIEKNVNALKIKEADQAKREQAKEQHAKKVQKDKEQREKELQQKEKAKKRTEKSEKRRGPG